MAIPFAMPRDEHPGTDLEQQLIRLLAIVSEIRMLLRLNTSNARERAAPRRAGGRGPARLPVISLSLDAGRVEMLVGATPVGGTTVTTVTTTTTTTTSSSGDGSDHQQVDDNADGTGPTGADAAVNAKRVAASLREMAEKLQNLHLADTDEIGDGCDSGDDVPDSRPINPPSAVPPVPAPSTSSSRQSTVTTVTTFTTTHHQRHPSRSDNVAATADSTSVLKKLSVPSVSLVVVPFAVMVGWHWFKGR